MNDLIAHERRPLWLARGPWLLLLIIAAAVYFGSYYRHGINFRDEGGTLTLLGGRILNGEVPFRDVELGYNVGWFMPIAGLFGITGVNFVALRIFFLVLSAIAAVLAFLTVERVARHAGRHKLAAPLAFLTGLMLVVVPGMIFKNYNPLAAVANSWCLVGFILARGIKESCWRGLVGGLILGATWLVRIDLGTFFSVLWLGVLFLRLFGLPGTKGERFAACLIGFVLLVVGVAAMHAPVVWDAYRRGYDKQFLGAYPNHWRTLAMRVPVLNELVKPKPAPVVGDAKPIPVAMALPSQPAAAAPSKQEGTWKNETLPRVSWNDVQSASDKRRNDVLGLFLLTYLPLLTILPLVAWAVSRWFGAVRNGQDANSSLAALALLGGALTMFPQFFLWRPDAPHLSEFGPGYWTAVIGATVLLSASARSRVGGVLMTLLILANAGVWLWRMVPDRWCGTIAARVNRETLFEGENGVRVYEQKKTVAWMNDVLKLIRERSGPNDFLIAYPYHPSFNVLANRRTYEKNVYVDNATAKPGWGKAAIERIDAHRPAIIIISDWDINGSDASRFRNWAPDTYAHVRANYELLGTFDEKEKFEVYARKTPAAVPAPSVEPAAQPAPAATPTPEVPAPAPPQQ